MNSDLIEMFLENFHEFQISRDIESRYLIWDINVAIYGAPLTITERSVIQRMYIDPPRPPERDRLDKNGFTNGRPLGGTTERSAGEEIGMARSTLGAIKRSAIDKIAIFLGEEYEK